MIFLTTLLFFFSKKIIFFVPVVLIFSSTPSTFLLTRLFFILIEGVTGRKVNPKFESYAHTIGMTVLLTLIALITFRDITRIISGQPLLPTP